MDAGLGKKKHESGNIHGAFQPGLTRLSQRFEEHQPDFKSPTSRTAALTKAPPGRSKPPLYHSPARTGPADLQVVWDKWHSNIVGGGSGAPLPFCVR